jgi:hypothetical protein
MSAVLREMRAQMCDCGDAVTFGDYTLTVEVDATLRHRDV